jgi:glycerol-3-phosphate dehydrogenase
MSSGELDLLVVGGGITGTGAALDGALRGLRVGLVEAADLASGASSKSSKLIHGGLRYLEMGDIGLVREGLRERELLLTRLAPHLVRPVPFLWPLRHRIWERAYLGAGMILYDTLGGARSVPRHRHLSRRGTRAAAPGLRMDGVAEDDARMVAVVARTAAAYGADVVTRARVTRLLRSGSRVAGAEVLDAESGEALTIRARQVALAVGAWTDALRATAAESFATEMRPSKGIHITVARDRIPIDTGILARTEKSVLFVIPTDDCWLIGDTDTPWLHGPDEPVANGADVDYVLAKTNALLEQQLGREDVRGVFAGLRPLVGPTGTSDTSRLSRNHVVETPVTGLTTIAGGKYTTYRAMAADLIDAATRELRGVPASRTANVPLIGAGGFAAAWESRGQLAESAGMSVPAMERLLRRYGDRVSDLLALISERPDLAHEVDGAGGHLGAEVVYACTHEGALHLEDVLERRTRVAITAADRGVAAAGPIASLMAEILGWGEERAEREVDSWRRRVAAQRAGEEQRDDESALRAYRAVLDAGRPPARSAR